MADMATELRARDPSYWDQLRWAVRDQLPASLRERYDAAADNPAVRGVADVAANTARLGLSVASPTVGAADMASFLSKPVESAIGGLSDWWMGRDNNPDPVTNPKDETWEEFSTRRRTNRQSLQKAMDAAEKRIMESEAYQNLTKPLKARNGSEYVPRSAVDKASKMVRQALETAKAGWEADQATIPAEEERLRGQFENIKAARKQFADDQNRKPWYERSPTMAAALTYGAPLAAGALAKYKFDKITKSGDELLDGVRAAEASGELGKEATARVALDEWRRKAPGQYVGAAGKAALIPAGMRAVGTAGDYALAPEIRREDGSVDPTSARQQARELVHKTFTSPQGFMEEMGPNFWAGLEGVAGGALLAKRGRGPEIKAESDYLKTVRPEAGQQGGIMARMLSGQPYRSMSPDEIAIPLGNARRKMLDEQAALAEARARPPRSSQAPSLQGQEPAPTSTLEPVPGMSAPPAGSYTRGEATQRALEGPRSQSAVGSPSLASALNPQSKSMYDAKTGRWRAPDGRFLPGKGPNDNEPLP